MNVNQTFKKSKIFVDTKIKNWNHCLSNVFHLPLLVVVQTFHYMHLLVLQPTSDNVFDHLLVFFDFLLPEFGVVLLFQLLVVLNILDILVVPDQFFLVEPLLFFLL